MANFSTFKGIANTVIVLLFCQNASFAQPQKGRFIDAAIGLGISAPYEDIDIYGTGFYGKVEYVIGYNKWVGIRPYAGVLFTSAVENEDYPDSGISSNIFFLGGKGRVAAPIPYIAPFLELGFGLSFGNLTTDFPIVKYKSRGVIPHIPFTFGLALGKNHNVELAFTYLSHINAKQFGGAAALGLSFPLD